MQQHRLSSQPGLHSSLRQHVSRPVARPLRVHGLQLLVAAGHAVQTPQLVVQTLTLLGQDVSVFERGAADRTGAAVGGEEEPRQGGILADVLFAHAALLQTQESS